MATVTKGKTFTATEQVTAAKLHQLVDSATVTAIVNADINAAAGIVDSKLAQIATAGKVSGAALTSLASVPSGAGVLPTANLPLTLTSQAVGFTIAGGTTSKTLTVSADATIGGSSVIAPATNTANYVPQWDGADSKTLKNGLAVGTSASNLVQLDGSAKLPAVDGSQLTGITISNYDSGWFAVTGNNTYTKAHSLSSSKLIVTAYYSDSSDGTGEVVASVPQIIRSSFDGQCAIVDIDSTNIVIRHHTNGIRYWDDGGNDTTLTSGYVRVLAIKLG
jgi:hypothetical protein